MKSETMKQDALYSAAKNLLETTLRLLNWNESSPYTREYCEDKVREAIKGLNAEMANKADDRAGKLATLTRRVAELEGASRLFLKACRCVDIQHNGFGRAFDAAQKALHEESK